MMGWGYGMMGGWVGTVLSVILIAIIIYAVIRLAGRGHMGNGNSYDNSIQILNERFARGEINEEEYKRIKTLIMKR